MSNAAPTIAPEVGKRYVTRDGQVTSPLRPYVSTYYPFQAEVGDRGILHAWTRRGRCDHVIPDPSPLDLVAEYVPTAEAPAPTEPPQLGKRYVTRAGHVTSPMEPTGMEKHPFRAGTEGTDLLFHWMNDGRYHQDLPHHPLDIVAEYVPTAEAPAPTFTPQVGKRYITRAGRVTGFLQAHESNLYPFYAGLGEAGDIITWTKEGKYDRIPTPHPLDLVAEYAPIAEPPPPTAPPPFRPPNGSFQSELTALINRHSIEGGSDTPDYILAEFLRQCLDAFDMATRQREAHKGGAQ